MRSYAQVSPTFWTRGPGKKLRGNPTAVALILYLQTSPATNMIGLFYQPLPMICHELDLCEEQVRALLALPAVADAARYDYEAELVWLPEHAREQLGDVIKPGDKRRASIQRELAAFDGHPFALEFAARYGVAFSLDPKPLPAVVDAPSKGLPAAQEPPFPSPSPSQVQSLAPDPRAPAPEAAPVPVAAAAPAWDERESPCPLDLVDKLKAAGVHVQLAEALNADVDAVVWELREFVTYWTIGKGTGRRKRHWALEARQRVVSRANEGKLKPPGSIEHDQRGALAPDLDAEVERLIAQHRPVARVLPAAERKAV